MERAEANANGNLDAVDRRLRISVVVPTYQRRELVVPAVEALRRQTFDQPYEVIVTVDGSTDGTAEALKALPVAFPLTILEQPNAGVAAARNVGARQARGEILLFLDDDMEAHPLLLTEHDRTHREGADAVLGHMPLHPKSPVNLISNAVKRWTEERLARLSVPGAELGLYDLLTGQLSVSKKVFRDIGGFDTAFTCRSIFGNENRDLGHRLLRGGYEVRFNPSAISHQRYVVTPRQHLRRWREAGRADVLFARKHPDEGLSIFAKGLSTRFARVIARPLARAPAWTLVTWPVRALALIVSDQSSAAAWNVFFRARTLEYWRGVSEAGGVPCRHALRILAYHAMSDLKDSSVLKPYGVPLDNFRRQIASLKTNGFHFIGADEFAAFATGRAGLPRRAVFVTFDDCYRDLLEVAPMLRDEGIGALAFAVSGQLGGENAWDRMYGGPALRLLDAAELRTLRESGVEIGAHSRTHPLLPTLATNELEAEVLGSIKDLEAVGVGRPRFFAFPYGESDDRVREIVRRAGVVAAFDVHPGVMDIDTDRMRIPRVEILRSDVGALFMVKVLFARQLGWASRFARASRAFFWRAARAVRRRVSGTHLTRSGPAGTSS